MTKNAKKKCLKDSVEKESEESIGNVSSSAKRLYVFGVESSSLFNVARKDQIWNNEQFSLLATCLAIPNTFVVEAGGLVSIYERKRSRGSSQKT